MCVYRRSDFFFFFSPELFSKLLPGPNTAGDATLNGLSGLTDSVGKQPLSVSICADCLCSAWTRSYTWTETKQCGCWPSKIPKEKCVWQIKTVENHTPKKKNSRNGCTSQILLLLFWTTELEILLGLKQDFQIQFVLKAKQEGLEKVNTSYWVRLCLVPEVSSWFPVMEWVFVQSYSSEQNTS